MATGNIVDSSAMDTFSENPTATYVVQAHGGTNKTYNSVCYCTAPITGVDPLSVPTVVAGAMKAPPAPPVPPSLTRGMVAPIVNSVARGVYIEKTLVPVIGDGIPGPGAMPDPRLLTGPGKYTTIIIGTRT